MSHSPMPHDPRRGGWSGPGMPGAAPWSIPPEPDRSGRTGGAIALVVVVVVALAAAVIISAANLGGDYYGGPAVQSGGPAGAVPTVTATSYADRQLCSDLNTMGGSYYRSFVVPVLETRDSGSRTVDTDRYAVAYAVQSLRGVAGTPLASGQSVLSVASPDLASTGRELVEAARAQASYTGADTTALYSAFVSLSTTCTRTGYRPTWFDADRTSW